MDVVDFDGFRKRVEHPVAWMLCQDEIKKMRKQQEIQAREQAASAARLEAFRQRVHNAIPVKGDDVIEDDVCNCEGKYDHADHIKEINKELQFYRNYWNKYHNIADRLDDFIGAGVIDGLPEGTVSLLINGEFHHLTGAQAHNLVAQINALLYNPGSARVNKMPTY
jgi:hypothetical protein